MEQKRDSSPPICDYEGSTYQSTFWEQGGREYEDNVEAIALRRLLPKNGRLMLEVGAGAGRNSNRYQGYQKIVLMDYSVTQLKQAQKNLKNNNQQFVFVAANAYDLPFVPGIFDGATMIRVLHHLADGPKVLDQIQNVMEPGGTFILEFANKKNFKAILRYWLGKQTWNPFSPEPVEFVDLNFNFHPKTTREWLKNSGFQILRQLTVSHFRIGLLKSLIPLPILVKLDSLAQLTGNWWQLSPSVFIKSRVPGTQKSNPNKKLFRCTVCSGSDFDENTDRLICATCKTNWLIEEGIYNFKKPALS